MFAHRTPADLLITLEASAPLGREHCSPPHGQTVKAKKARPPSIPFSPSYCLTLAGQENNVKYSKANLVHGQIKPRFPDYNEKQFPPPSDIRAPDRKQHATLVYSSGICVNRSGKFVNRVKSGEQITFG